MFTITKKQAIYSNEGNFFKQAPPQADIMQYNK